MGTRTSNWVVAAAAAVGLQAMGCQASVRADLHTAASSIPSVTTCAAPGQAAETFDWEPARRAAFDRAAQNGVVVLRAQGCDWVVLEGCQATQRYEWHPKFSVASDGGGREGEFGVQIAGRASGGTQREARTSSEIVTVGHQELAAQRVSSNDLKGACRGATHVVSRIRVGAFRISSLHSSNDHVGIGPAGFASQQTWRGSLRQEGQPERCAANGERGQPACSAAIAVALAPIVSEPAPVAVAGNVPSQVSAPAAPNLNVQIDACAAGNAQACAAQCNAGIRSACTAQSVLCATGDANACTNGGLALITQFFVGGR